MGSIKRVREGDTQTAIAIDRRRKMKQAVRDLPDPKRRGLTQEDIETLRKANLGKLAALAERYI